MDWTGVKVLYMLDCSHADAGEALGDMGKTFQRIIALFTGASLYKEISYYHWGNKWPVQFRRWW